MASIGIIGLGEAGSVYAQAFAQAGHTVYGSDPAPVETPEGVERVDGFSGLELDFVLVLTSARVAGVLADSVLASLPEATVWIDMSTASPAQKARVAENGTAKQQVDIAILGPVILQGISTPLLAAGAEAERVAALFAEIDSPVEVVDGGAPGDAIAHKLLRSILMKGLAAIVTEAVAAGAAAGREQWIRNQIAAQLAGDGHAVVDRFLTGSVKHAARRADEMASVVNYLSELGVSSDMSAGAQAQLTRLKEQYAV